MITQRDIILGVILPAVVCGLVVFVGWVMGGRAARAGAPLGVAAGFVGGYAALSGAPGLRPLDSIQWVFHATIALGLLGAIDAVTWGRRTKPFRWSIRAICVLGLSIAVNWLIARPLLVFAWTGWRGPVYIGALALIMLVVWVSLDLLARRGQAVSFNIALAAMAAVASAVVAMSGSQRLGQTGGLLTSAMSALAVLSWLLSGVGSAPGATLVFAVVYVALVSAASEHLYANLTSLNAGLLLAAPFLAWAGEFVPARRAWARGSTRIAATLLPGAIAIFLAGIAFAKAASDYSEYGH